MSSEAAGIAGHRLAIRNGVNFATILSVVSLSAVGAASAESDELNGLWLSPSHAPADPIARGTPASNLWSKGRRFEMTETLSRPIVPAAEERARLKEGIHIERSSRRVRTYFGGKLIAD